MRIEHLSIPDVLLIEPKRFGDHRGLFAEMFIERELAAAGFPRRFIQENLSRSANTGTVRALHLQNPPAAQDKLVRVSRGRIFDVVVDVRHGSPTYGRHVSAELSADNWLQLLVPAGFLHGFATLEPDTEVQYKVTNYYSPVDEVGVLWNDPDLGIAWPVGSGTATLSSKDAVAPRFRDYKSLFSFGA